MTTSLKIIGGIAILGVILGGLALLKHSSTTVVAGSTTNSSGGISNTNAPAANTVLVNGQLLPNPSVLDYFVSRVFLYADGAIGFGNSSRTPILQQAQRNASFTATTTTFCSLQNPFTTASSSYEASFYVASSSANAGTVVFGAASTNAATTSSTNQQGQLTVAPGDINYATSGTTTSGTFGIIGPGQFLNFSGGSTGSATSQFGGTCQSIFTSLN